MSHLLDKIMSNSFLFRSNKFTNKIFLDIYCFDYP